MAQTAFLQRAVEITEDFAERQGFLVKVERALERILAMLVPGITVLVGVVVALIMAAVMTAMVSLNELAV